MSIHLESPTLKTSIYLAKEGQIVLLNLKKAANTILTKYSYYTDISMSMSFKRIS